MTITRTATGHALQDLPELVTRSDLARRGVRRVDLDRIWARTDTVLVPGSTVVYARRDQVLEQLVVVPAGGVRPRGRR